MADCLGLAQPQSQGSDLVRDGSRQTHGRQDYRGGGVGHHRGSLDLPQASIGRQLGPLPGCDLRATAKVGAYDNRERQRRQAGAEGTAQANGPPLPEEPPPRTWRAPTIGIPIPNQTVGGNEDEQTDLVSPEEQITKWHNFVGSYLSFYCRQTCANRDGGRDFRARLRLEGSKGLSVFEDGDNDGCRRT